MVFRELTKEDGYTIVELMIALTIISIVLSTVASVFLFVNRQMNSWSAGVEFYNNYQIVQNKVFNDLIAAENISVSDTALTVVYSDYSNTYSWLENQLHYNGTRLTASEGDSLMLEVGNNESDVKLFQWSIRQKDDRKNIDQEFLLNLRKPVYWKPMEQANAGRN
ncbi:MAG: PilW family protein [Balneola sp.]